MNVSTTAPAAPPISTERQRLLLAQLQQLAADRATDLTAIQRTRSASQEQASRSYLQMREASTQRFEQQHAHLVAEYKKLREKYLGEYEQQGCDIAASEGEIATEAARLHADELDKEKHVWQMRCRQIETTYKEQKFVPKAKALRIVQQCEQRTEEINKLLQAGKRVVQKRISWPAEDNAEPFEPTPGLTAVEYWNRGAFAIGRAQAQLRVIERQSASRFLEDGWPFLLFIFPLIGAIVLAWMFFGTLGWPGAIVLVTAIPLLCGPGSWLIVRPFSRRQTARATPPFQQAIREALAETKASEKAANDEALAARKKLKEQKVIDLKEQNDNWHKIQEQLATDERETIAEAAYTYGTRRKRLEQRIEPELDRIEGTYPPKIVACEQSYVHEMQRLASDYRQKLHAIEAQFQDELAAAAQRWNQGLSEIQEELNTAQQFCRTNFVPWPQRDASEQGFQTIAPNGEIEALRLGHYAFELDLPPDEATTPAQAKLFQAPPPAFELPAVLSYPDSPSLLLEAEGDGRDAATQVLQNVMLRLLTTFPPGKVRFTILDPVGLGQNFSAFMHLADFDDRLVSNRIWTEANHIQQRLTDLTEHMENVIQKYLRNEFASIQEYNRFAGEVAEPFQILVIANFPANFSDEAARRLASIVSSGARCGVYTLISVDTRLKLPRNCELSDLESQATTLIWDEATRSFRFQQEDLKTLPLQLEQPPDDQQMTDFIRSVGKRAKESSRVEVPFASVLPPESAWWSGDSRSEIEVPLGRAGATKLQYLRLGKGTSQHVLISGKTGSGKSTLLNALITNLAIYYSPNELEFYLIDFKKGVEFKAYASLKLPHARVIAIESEREFGLSVLERLDVELKRRGDLFRRHGVQDLKGFRQAQPEEVMPRILLIIDEFQEFFTSDDKISHESSLYLDRLVRQGRAFGIHVMLGSQTLAGAYSLARSTLGQMAVRIALQCSEADAHLILSEDNTAARLLSRPGEAIYNDANGMLEGNHPFQVVWLSDVQREHYLQHVLQMAQERQIGYRQTTVFEGNVAADPADNPQLIEALQRTEPLPITTPPRIWLGSAVAIKEPPQLDFQRQSGGNLLIVGQQEELAGGIMSNALLALAAQIPPEAADGLKSIQLLDGTRPESPDVNLWQRVVSVTGDRCELVTPRNADATITRISEEVDRRLANPDEEAPPLFLFIYNLSRFRDLKKGDDFSFDDAGSDGGKQLANILKEGPAVGVHAIVWADSFSNASRWLERSTIRDLDFRVLFQMSANDSSNLMDSPAASRLGVSVALFASEERGQSEKFRPYALPTDAWLGQVKRAQQ